jgi:ribosomal protein S27AE
MPVHTLHCPDCGHGFKGLVLANTQPPREWVCSKCGSHRAQQAPGSHLEPHPWEHQAGGGCLCCGGHSTEKHTHPEHTGSKEMT